MCESGDHWCSNCSSKVDSGKTGEYKVLDFLLNLKAGTMESHERTVICKRCLENPTIKEFLTFVEELEKMPPPPEVKKEERADGETGCYRCGKLLTPEVQTVALSIAWDVSYRSLTHFNCVMCKNCYNYDAKTRAVWQFLAKLGKNPTFQPRVTCASSVKCATYQKGNHLFGCINITVTRNDDMEEVMTCAKMHPRQYKFPYKGRHLGTKRRRRKGTRVRGPFPTNPSWNKRQKRQKQKAKKLQAKIKAAMKKTDDPAMKVLLEVVDTAFGEILSP